MAAVGTRRRYRADLRTARGPGDGGRTEGGIVGDVVVWGRSGREWGYEVADLKMNAVRAPRHPPEDDILELQQVCVGHLLHQLLELVQEHDLFVRVALGPVPHQSYTQSQRAVTARERSDRPRFDGVSCEHGIGEERTTQWVGDQQLGMLGGVGGGDNQRGGGIGGTAWAHR